MKHFTSISRFGVLLVLVCLLIVPAASARADDGSPPIQAPGLVQVVEMLAQGVAVGFVVAFLFEKPGWFKSLSTDAKWWIIFGLSLGLPILAQLALEFVPADVWSRLEPYWLALARGFLVWASSQAAFKVFVRS